MPALLLPIVGPLLVKLAPWLALVPGLAQFRRWAAVAVYVAVLGAGVWGGVKVHAWWTGDRLTQQQANAQTKAALVKAALDARAAQIEAERKAMAERVAALESRERQVSDMEAQQADFLRQLEEDRGNGASDHAAFVRADDQWLRAWQRRGR